MICLDFYLIDNRGCLSGYSRAFTCNMTQNTDIYGYLSGYSRTFSRYFVYERQNERQRRWFCRPFGPKQAF